MKAFERLRTLVPTLLLLLLQPAGLSAFGQFDPQGDSYASHWDQLPVEVIVDGGTLFGGHDGLALVRAAAEIWNGVTGVPRLFSVSEQADGIDYRLDNRALWNVADRRVRVVFDEGGEVLLSQGLDPESRVLGVAYTLPDFRGAAVQGLVIINGHESVSNFSDPVAVIVHELGHILGLTHTPIGFGGLEPVSRANRPTMYPFTENRNMDTLEADDIAGVRSIYGEGR